ncbi:charged multivesicular body protein 6-like [Watersipora subatra]|uniref:charged multivesicular body protein 6-like n=1 Tax=Watersipora subatra TaxID=2589382 RepID=UPI00355BF602
MGNLFGKKSSTKQQPSRVTEADKAVLQLKQQRDKLKQYQKKIQSSLERERQFAKKLLSEGNRDKAKLLLRKKKFQEGLIDKTESQLETIEQLVHDLEFAQIESQVLEGLKKGNESLKKMQQLVSLDEVEKIMDETADAVEYQRQISDLLSGGLTDDDEADVLDELSELLAAESEEQEVTLPEVPTEELPSGEPVQETQGKSREKPAREAMLAS